MKANKKRIGNRCFMVAVAALAMAALLLMLYPLIRLIIDALVLFFQSADVLPGLSKSVLSTLNVLCLVLLIVVPTAFCMALWMYEVSHVKPLRRLRACITVMAWIPAVFLGLLGRMLLYRYLGGGRLSMVILLSVFVLPFMVTRFEQALRSVPENIRAAGLILGASRMAVLVNLILPKAIWELLRACVMCVERVLGEATALLILLGAASEDSVLSMELFRLAGLGRKDAAVLALVLVFALCALRLLTSKRWSGGEERMPGGLGWRRD